MGRMGGVASNESDLIIVSLVRYADSCAPARRHSDCPFAVEQHGQLTCREECRGVITSLLRRGHGEPTPGSQAFDARQLRLSEPDGAPDTLWHTSSLLQVVVDATRNCPLRRDGSFDLRRYVNATSALGALGCRGLDPEQLIRRGVRQAIKIGLALWVGRWLESSVDPRSSWEHIDRWRAIFEDGTEDKQSPIKYINAAIDGPTAQRLDAWIASASIKDLLLWIPPLDSQTQSLGAAPVAEEVELWRWIVERFTRTYLEKWSLASLKREYSFTEGSWIPDFPAMLLEERALAREEIAIALADRAMVSDDEIDPSTMDSFTDQALILLADGQRVAAAALFDAARRLKPADMSAQNNYAFCILIDKPDQARELFIDVLTRGASDPPVTRCNLALAESLLGQTDAALHACEQAYEAADDKGARQTAYLWQRRDDEWVVERTNPRSWAVRLGAELEQAAETSAVWAERINGLNLTENQGTSADPSSTKTGEEDL